MKAKEDMSLGEHPTWAQTAGTAPVTLPYYLMKRKKRSRKKNINNNILFASRSCSPEFWDGMFYFEYL
jgi:hypothetical protein